MKYFFFHGPLIFFPDNESYYKNTLGHYWEDLKKKHCNMMKEIAVQNGQPAGELVHDLGELKACDSIRQNYSCYICKNNRLNQETQGSKVEKPYVLTRAKVDFTIEDLENDTEDIDFSPDVSVPDIYERQQPKRICKKDLFLNQ